MCQYSSEAASQILLYLCPIAVHRLLLNLTQILDMKKIHPFIQAIPREILNFVLIYLLIGIFELVFLSHSFYWGYLENFYTGGDHYALLSDQYPPIHTYTYTQLTIYLCWLVHRYVNTWKRYLLALACLAVTADIVYSLMSFPSFIIVAYREMYVLGLILILDLFRPIGKMRASIKAHFNPKKKEQTDVIWSPLVVPLCIMIVLRIVASLFSYLHSNLPYNALFGIYEVSYINYILMIGISYYYLKGHHRKMYLYLAVFGYFNILVGSTRYIDTQDYCISLLTAVYTLSTLFMLWVSYRYVIRPKTQIVEETTKA